MLARQPNRDVRPETNKAGRWQVRPGVNDGGGSCTRLARSSSRPVAKDDIEPGPPLTRAEAGRKIEEAGGKIELKGGRLLISLPLSALGGDLPGGPKAAAQRL
jgi:hypothetical protein